MKCVLFQKASKEISLLFPKIGNIELKNALIYNTTYILYAKNEFYQLKK